MHMQAAPQIRQIIGANIARRRSEMGLSRRALAEALGTDQTLIYKWERGIHRPDEQNMAALVRVCDREMGWWYTEHDDEPVAA